MSVRILCLIVGIVIICFLLGGGRPAAIITIVGAGTIITAFFMGPLIDFFNNKVSIPFLNKANKGDSKMDFNELNKKRYSCKKFSDKPVEEKKLQTILEAGRLAPTAKNLQEQHIYVVKSEEVLDKIDSETPCRYSAPVVLVVAYNKNNVFVYPGEKRNSGIEDATIVATHMMLAAASEGVDSCWINYFDPDKMAVTLGLPENEEILMLLDLGYASKGTKPLPNHTNRKELGETVTYL